MQVKPGRDYFTESFFTLFVIFLFTLVYWKQINGFSSQIDLNHFTTGQVILLFALLILLLLERMLYRARSEDNIILKNRLAIRLGLYLVQVTLVHFIFTLLWPLYGGI